MFRHGWILSVLAMFLFATQLAAQTTSPTVYVSTGTGAQIVAIDGSSGAVAGVCNTVASNGTSVVPFTPEDVVVGPDGLLYVADTTGNRIFRLNAALPAPASPAANCILETIYDAAAHPVCTAAPNNTTVNCPTGPEGLSFLRVGTLDLYFNTHGTNTGVWRIPNIAGLASCAPNCPGPVQALAPFGSGEGVDFDIFGNLLAVDQANGRVLSSIAPGFTSSTSVVTGTSLITGLSTPFGIALNTCNDVLVATGNLVSRYDSASANTFKDRLRFNGNDKPKYLEVDSANNLYVVTASDETGSGGKLWRFDAPSVTTCALGSFTVHSGFPVVFKSNLAAGVATANALGVGLSATNVSTGTLSFTPQQLTNVYSFGAQHSMSVTCTNLVKPFNMSVTALKTRPNDSSNSETNFSTPFQCPSPNGPVTLVPVCVHYGSQHGFCTQYVEHAFDPATGVEFDGNTACGNFVFKIGAFAAEFISSPGAAHSFGAATADVFNDCASQDFYPAAGPGLDFGVGASNTKHVVFNSALSFNGTISLNAPTSSCGIATLTCNPQFNHNQNISVKFTLLDSNGNPVPSSTFAATERLSILRIKLLDAKGNVINTDQVAEPVVSTNSSGTAFFSGNGSGQYSLGVDASALDANAGFKSGTQGVYQFTIWGNGAAPFSFDILVKF